MKHLSFYVNIFKTPPKRVRHVIYVEALKLYREDIVKYRGDCRGMCHALHRATHTSSDRLISQLGAYAGMKVYGKNVKYLPEIVKYKPKDSSCMTYWFPLSSTDVRLRILKQAVRDTKKYSCDIRKRHFRMVISTILKKAALLVGSAIMWGARNGAD